MFMNIWKAGNTCIPKKCQCHYIKRKTQEIKVWRDTQINATSNLEFSFALKNNVGTIGKVYVQ